MYRGQTGISHWWNITHNKKCTGDRHYNTHELKFHKWPLQTHTHTDGQSQIVAYRAATFAAKKVPKSVHYFRSYWWAPINKNSELTQISSKKSTQPNSYLWGPINNSGNNGQILELFFLNTSEFRHESIATICSSFRGLQSPLEKWLLQGWISPKNEALRFDQRHFWALLGVCLLYTSPSPRD